MIARGERRRLELRYAVCGDAVDRVIRAVRRKDRWRAERSARATKEAGARHGEAR